MFTKLNISLPYPEFEFVGTGASFSSIISPNKVPLISYQKIKGKAEQEMLEIIPIEHRDKFQAQTMIITSTLVPHTDSAITCSINYYFETNNEKTVFYKLLPGAKSIPILRRETGKAFMYKDLEEIGSFIAKSGEIWVLDVSKPHNLISENKEQLSRKAIVLQTTHFSYDEVLLMLKDYLS